MSDVLDHKSDLTFFARGAARTGSETELGTSEDSFFFLLGLHLTLGSKSLRVVVMTFFFFFLLFRFFPTEKPLQFLCVYTKTVPMSGA